MGKNPDPGSGINIPDPPHWCCRYKKVYKKTMHLAKMRMVKLFFQLLCALAHFSMELYLLVSEGYNYPQSMQEQ
jgi:hypothetical protein